MFNSILTFVAAFAMTAGPTQDPPQRHATDVEPGRIAWFDITTSDLARSKEFYGKLFGWTFNSLQGTEFAVEIVSGGEPVGTLRVAEGKISAFNGVVYVRVPDVVASCDKAKELGGTVVPGFPFDLWDGSGAIGLALDPSGHPLGMFSKKLIQSNKAQSQ